MTDSMIYVMRQQTYTTLFIFMLGIFSCTNKEVVSKPMPFIDEKQMAQILTEMHLAEAISTNQIITEDSLWVLRKSLYEAVYQKFGFDEQTFKANIEYYKQQPMLMDSIYSQIITHLMTMEESYSVKFQF